MNLQADQIEINLPKVEIDLLKSQFLGRSIEEIVISLIHEKCFRGISQESSASVTL